MRTVVFGQYVLFIALIHIPAALRAKGLSLCSQPKLGRSVQDTKRGAPLPPSALGSFMLERNVTARSVSWSRKMTPLQLYRGKAVKAAKKLDLVETKGPSKSAQYQLDRRSDLSANKRRQLEMKLAAEARASQPLDPDEHLHILYCDEHICVTSKPSGILSVPGPRRNPSLAGLVHGVVAPEIDIDRTVVHRIDMDTSGIVVFALSEQALKKLHDDFRERRVKKSYEALLCGHLSKASEIEVDVALERDPFHPPFMRIAQPEGKGVDKVTAVHPTFQKFINQAPKPALSRVEIKSLEYLAGESGDRLPVTRVALIPHTGRTHQLRVHTASLGYPIVGDDIYGYKGEGHCGIDHLTMDTKREKLHRRIHALGLNLCLHARQLSFFHPVSGAPMSFECEVPF